MTLTQWWQIFLALASSIITMGGAGAVIFKIHNYFKRPNTERDKALSDINDKLKSHDEKLDNDNRRLKELEEGNKVLMKAMLALMTHSIDGNHVEELRLARDEMQDYLIRR